MDTTTTKVIVVRVTQFPDDTPDTAWTRAVRIADQRGQIFDGLSIRRDNRNGEWVAKFRMVAR
jgi:hypothetical protein